MECPAGAIFLSWRLAGSDGGGRGVCRRGRCPMPCVRAYPPEKSHAIRLDEVSIKSEKRCNSNDQNSKLEAVAGELHAKLVVDSGMRGVGLDVRPGRGAGGWRGLADTTQHRRRRRCGGRRRDWWAWLRCRWVAVGSRARSERLVGAWLRCPWAVAGPGRASRRCAERSSRRGRLAGGPPPTGTQSSPDRRKTPAQPPAFTASQQHSQKSYEKYESFIGSS